MPKVKRFLAKNAKITSYRRGVDRVLRFSGDVILEILITEWQARELGSELYVPPPPSPATTAPSVSDLPDPDDEDEEEEE